MLRLFSVCGWYTWLFFCLWSLGVSISVPSCVCVFICYFLLLLYILPCGSRLMLLCAFVVICALATLVPVSLSVSMLCLLGLRDLIFHCHVFFVLSLYSVFVLP